MHSNELGEWAANSAHKGVPLPLPLPLSLSLFSDCILGTPLAPLTPSCLSFITLHTKNLSSE